MNQKIVEPPLTSFYPFLKHLNALYNVQQDTLIQYYLKDERFLHVLHNLCQPAEVRPPHPQVLDVITSPGV